MKPKIALTGEQWSRSLDEGVSFLERHQGFLFCAYPDADAVGSMLALALHLKLRGKKSWLLKPGPLHDNLDFLFDILQHNHIPILNCPADILETAPSVDAVVFCDTANRNLVPHFNSLDENLLQTGRPVLEIDHHFGTDAGAVTANGLHLFRKSNATAEIAAELLDRFALSHPDDAHPFLQRNILVSLLTGLITDTGGGRASVEPEDYAYWTTRLGSLLQNQTHSKGDESPIPQFENTEAISEFLDQLSAEQAGCLEVLKKNVVVQEGVGCLTLLDSAMKDLDSVYHTDDPVGFAQVREVMANVVAEMSRAVGLLAFRDKTAQGDDCVYLKLRCAPGCPLDLRDLENSIHEAFGEANVLGGGGHPGAVSFRIGPREEEVILQSVDRLIPKIQEQLGSQ